MPETLEHLVLAMDGGKYDIASSGYTFIGHDNERDMYLFPGQEPSVFDGEEIIRRMLNDGETIWYTCWNKLIQRSLVDRLRFEPIAQEDFLFCSELYLNVSRIIFLSESLYRYYDRQGSLSKNISYIGYYKTVPVLWELYGHIPESRRRLRSFLLVKIYRRILFSLYMAKESDIPAAERETHRNLCKSIIKESRKTFLTDMSVPLKEKLLYIAVRTFFRRRH